jgi:hypothetical protein
MEDKTLDKILSELLPEFDEWDKQDLQSTILDWHSAELDKAILEARIDELKRIPVIETSGVGYKTIVKHRIKRFVELSQPTNQASETK